MLGSVPVHDALNDFEQLRFSNSSQEDLIRNRMLKIYFTNFRPEITQYFVLCPIAASRGDGGGGGPA